MNRPTPDNADDRAADLAGQQEILRLRAEQSLPALTPTTTSYDWAFDSQRLLHELQVHQIELELQHEELLASRTEVERLLLSYQELYDFAPVAYFTLDRAGQILQANLTAARMLGLERIHLTQRRLGVFVAQQDLPILNALLQRVFDGQPRSHCECRLADPDQLPWQTLHVEATLGPDGNCCHVVATDITPLKMQQRQLEQMALYDTVTKLPNRVLLADRLQQAMTQCQRSGRSLAVAYLDLDGFKAVNDQHGHILGDQLLLALAQRMQATLRKGDTLARIGGDEFVAVLVDLGQAQDCKPLLQRLLQAAGAPTVIGDRTLQVSASIGVTLYPQDAADADLLLRHADQAMYQAKQDGRNRYHLFDLHQHDTLRSQSAQIAEICAGLRQGEFELHYQPKVNMRTGAVVGAEALIRWRHPERGLLAPASFLHLLENHPSSEEMCDWVLSAALEQMKAWQDAGLEIAVSVNISAFQLQQDSFVPKLTQRLTAAAEARPPLLEIEVLETSALENMAKVAAMMRDCHALGVRFALDDFGTGYSSLTYLRHLPADLLKIDRSFVAGMLDDANDRAIVESVIGLARAFQREVIAEGVETPAHGALLLEMGCDLAQGYAFARPMPGADMPAWIMQWRSSWATGQQAC
jgi:diguanylate cyclase (GGDEF)-like protein/PAS domain S-box-containing protein